MDPSAAVKVAGRAEWRFLSRWASSWSYVGRFKFAIAERSLEVE
jgi:hypothetical protein